MASKAKCGSCERARTEYDRDYNPISYVLNNIVGWFSGGGEEMCGDCLRKMMKLSNGGAR